MEWRLCTYCDYPFQHPFLKDQKCEKCKIELEYADPGKPAPPERVYFPRKRTPQALGKPEKSVDSVSDGPVLRDVVSKKKSDLEGSFDQLKLKETIPARAAPIHSLKSIMLKRNAPPTTFERLLAEGLRRDFPPLPPLKPYQMTGEPVSKLKLPNIANKSATNMPARQPSVALPQQVNAHWNDEVTQNELQVHSPCTQYTELKVAREQLMNQMRKVEVLESEADLKLSEYSLLQSTLEAKNRALAEKSDEIESLRERLDGLEQANGRLRDQVSEQTKALKGLAEDKTGNESVIQNLRGEVQSLQKVETQLSRLQAVIAESATFGDVTIAVGESILLLRPEMAVLDRTMVEVEFNLLRGCRMTLEGAPGLGDWQSPWTTDYMSFFARLHEACEV